MSEAGRKTTTKARVKLVAKTNGESMNFEGRIFAKREIVKKTLVIYSIFDSHKSACAPDHRKRSASATVQK